MKHSFILFIQSSIHKQKIPDVPDFVHLHPLLNHFEYPNEYFSVEENLCLLIWVKLWKHANARLAVWCDCFLTCSVLFMMLPDHDLNRTDFFLYHSNYYLHFANP
jgi:hypothetical protein